MKLRSGQVVVIGMVSAIVVVLSIVVWRGLYVQNFPGKSVPGATQPSTEPATQPAE